VILGVIVVALGGYGAFQAHLRQEEQRAELYAQLAKLQAMIDEANAREARARTDAGR
jgi:hypothetical protein